MAPIREPTGCGHHHQTWNPRGPDGPHRLYVVVVPTGCCQATPSATEIRLSPGDLLRLDLNDWTLQGCAGCEDLLVWSRFHVLTGPHAGECIEFQERNPNDSDPMLPRWAGGVAVAPVEDAVAASIRYASLGWSSGGS